MPLSLLYSFILWVRNILFNKNWLKSSSFNFPIICVGNLAVGGTGKTPMVEYLLRLLKNDYAVATLSRGYKRKTIGFGIADSSTTALDIGDEPMQFHVKFPDVTVSVGEERLVAIPQLLHDRPQTKVIILDDAFQHRQVKAGLNILLTEYANLYSRDFLLPAGDLRDIKLSADRAEIIIVTKCKHNLSLEEKRLITRELKLTASQQIFFTKIVYTNPYHLFTKKETNIIESSAILLVCGIANPKPLKDFLTASFNSYDMLRFPDHHIFNIDDLKEIKSHFHDIQSDNKIIITTEKDGVRLTKFENELRDFPLYVLPIQHEFIFDDADKFNKIVFNFINNFQHNNVV